MFPDDFKPYLLRAFYEYLTDQELTPYIHVYVNKFTQVPMEYVKDQAITLNISVTASPDIQINNDFLTFNARFSGQIREIRIPLGHVLAIYAREETERILSFPLQEMTTENSAELDSKVVHKSKEKKTKAPPSFLKVVKKASDPD